MYCKGPTLATPLGRSRWALAGPAQMEGGGCVCVFFFFSEVRIKQVGEARHGSPERESKSLLQTLGGVESSRIYM